MAVEKQRQCMSRDGKRLGTRRRFLESTAVGGLAVGLVGTGTAAARTKAADHVTWECDHVALSNVGDLDTVRVDFQNGSYVQSANGISGEEPVRLGSPGRTIDTATITFGDGSEETLDNPSPDCDRRRLATSFTATRVHVPPAEFVLSRSVPGVLTTSVTLHFADGTTQRKQHYSGDGDGEVDDFPEVPGLASVYGMDAVPNTYRGSGAHAGKVVGAIEIATDEGYRTHYLRSDCSGACLYGAETVQERIVEVVGTSEGAVRYEFTATGPIHRVGINARIETEANDAVSENGDGTVTVTGFTGNTGYGDSYVVNGEITDFQQTGGDGEYVVRSMERRLLDY